MNIDESRLAYTVAHISAKHGYNSVLSCTGNRLEFYTPERKFFRNKRTHRFDIFPIGKGHILVTLHDDTQIISLNTILNEFNEIHTNVRITFEFVK